MGGHYGLCHWPLVRWFGSTGGTAGAEDTTVDEAPWKDMTPKALMANGQYFQASQEPSICITM